MRRIINKKTAIGIVILLFILIVLLSVWPFRVWTTVKGYTAGGEMIEYSESVGAYDHLLQKFVVQYERLSSISVYVQEMKRGRYITASLLDENASEIYRVFVDTGDKDIPGFVEIPMEINLEVGKEYYLSIYPSRAEFVVGLEDVPDDPGYVGSIYRNWEEIPARHLAAVYNYRLPMDKSDSLIIILLGIVAAIISLSVIDLYYKKRPEKNTLYTLEQAMRYVANPVAALFFGSLMIMVFPLKVFDLRAADIIFYEIGLLICAGIAFYGINHKVVSYNFGISFWQDVDDKDKVVSVFMMGAVALALWYACGYMNDLYDIYHTLSERKMVICLLALIILTFSFRQVVNLRNLVWIVASVIWGIGYYRTNCLDITEKEADLKNAALKLFVAVVILGGLVLINLVSEIAVRIRNRVLGKHDVEPGKLTLTKFGIALAVFCVFLIVFRNTRFWGIYLVLTYLALYLRLYFWKGSKNWYRILAGGLMLNFAISLAFSLMYRYFAGFVSGRFAFIFHTVTVTAEYLTFMVAAVAVMLIIKIKAFPGDIKVVELFKSAWKEIVLFGFIMSYAIFTVSRTAYAAIAVCVLTVMIVTTIGNLRQFFRIMLTMLVAVVLCFPAAFTMQRIVPVIVADPVFYDIDDADPLVRGGATWNSPNFMCVERFAGLFSSKILGIDPGDYNYPTDVNNYNADKTPVYDEYGNMLDGSEDGYGLIEFNGIEIVPSEDALVSVGVTRAQALLLADTMNDYVDLNNKLDVISNGRITIFKSYIKELNLTGHDKMGAELPSGEIAVHAHNTYIQVSYDNGIVTGVLFTVMLISALISGIILYKKNEKKDPLTLIIFATTIGFAVAGISEWVFHFCNPMTVALMLSFAGLVFKEKNV